MPQQLPTAGSGGHREVVIFEESEYGVDGSSWEWIATVRISDDGHRSATLEQVPWEHYEDWFDNSYELDPIESGQQLFEFLNASWADEHFEDIPEDAWPGISSKIGAIDSVLAAELRAAIKDEFDPDPPAVDLDAVAFEQFIHGASFHKEPRRGGGAMWAGIADNLRAQAAIRWFCQSYLQDHGHLPSGTHRVTCRFGDTPDADLPNPEGRGLRVIGDATFDKEVTFVAKEA